MLQDRNYKQILLKQAKRKPEIFWDIPKKSIENLSNESLLERLLNYGDMDQLRKIVKNKKEFEKNYLKIRNKKRCNLFPEVINYIDLYLNKDAQRSIK
jgi:hypothetical protein